MSTHSSAEKSASLLDRARALIKGGRLAAVPLAAVAVTAGGGGMTDARGQGLTVDYAGIVSNSNSGFFTGVFLDTDSAGGSVAGNTATLTGEKTLTDSLFWRYDDFLEKTVPRSDTTGLAFFWGGALPGGTKTYEDALQLNFSFSVDYTHTIASAYDSSYISYQVYVGFGSTQYELDPGYPQSPRNSAGYYSQTSDSHYDSDTGANLDFSGSLSVEFPEWAGAGDYWFVQVEVNWNNEYANSYYWNDDYSKLNGDMLTAGMTPGAMTLTFVPAAAAVPEPAEAVMGAGLLAALAVAWRRCWNRRV